MKKLYIISILIINAVGSAFAMDGNNSLKRKEPPSIKKERAQKRIKRLIPENLSNGESLLRAAKSKNAAKIKKILEVDPSLINIKNEQGQNSMHLINMYNVFAFSKPLSEKLEGLKTLLEYGADVNAEDKNGNTPLHYAAEGGDISDMKLLMAAPFVFAYSNKVNQKKVPSLKKLVSNYLTKNTKVYNDNAKKIILEAILNFDHEDRATFNDIIFTYGKNPTTFNNLSKEKQHQFMKKVKNKHLSIIQSMIQLKNEDGITKEIVEYLNKISEAKKYDDLDNELKEQIKSTYKELLELDIKKEFFFLS